MAKYRFPLSECVVVAVIFIVAVFWVQATDTYCPEMDIDMESTYDIKDAVDITQDGDLTTGGDTTTTNLTASAQVKAEHIYSTDDGEIGDDLTVGGDATVTGTVTGDTVTDGTTTITGGNYTGVGNITGSDVDISAGTGDFTTTGDANVANLTASAQVKAEHLYSTDDIYVTDEIQDGDGANPVTVAELNTAYDHSQDNTQAHTDYLLNSGADEMAGALTCDGIIMDDNHTIGWGGDESITFDGTDFQITDNLDFGTNILTDTLVGYVDQDVTSGSAPTVAITNFSGTGTVTQLTATGEVYVSDQVYGVEWNGELSTPTKNAVYDKIEVVNTAVGLNTSKVTNATHTGDVTGATALTIGADKILESMLKCVNAAVDEYVLTYESTTGDFEWEEDSGGTTISTAQLNAAGLIYNLNQTEAATIIYTNPDGNVLIGDINDFATTPFGESAKGVMAFPAVISPSTGGTDTAMLYGKGSPDSNTKLLLHLNGADAATSTTDSSASGHTINFNGAAQLDVDQKKFGATSCLFADATTNYLNIAANADWNFGTGAVTVDTWIRMASVADIESIMGVGQDNPVSEGFFMLHAQMGTDGVYDANAFTVSGYSGAAWHSVEWAVTLSANTWYHIAVVRSVNTVYLFVDGTSQGTNAYTWSYGSASQPFTIGKGGATASAAYCFDGWVDEVRVSNVARWTANFSAPTSEYEGNTSVELFCMDEDGNETQLSPHKFKRFIPSEDSRFPWSYYSENKTIGVEINVNMYDAIKDLEKITGKKYIYEKSIEMRQTKEKERLATWVEAKRQKEIEFRATQKAIKEAEYLEWLALQEEDEPDTGIIP